MRLKKARKYLKFDWDTASDIKKRAKELVKSLEMDWINSDRIFFYRSTGSKSRAYARTWGLPKLWQNALGVEPSYIIEVISHYFDHLPQEQKDKIILHELSHIPRNFSGALVPHTRHRKGSFHDKLESLYNSYIKLRAKR